MNTQQTAYKSISDLTMWYKLRSGDDLMLIDVPAIIPLRWEYFKVNWGFIKQQLLESIPQYSNPDFLSSQIADFSRFIDAQRIQRGNPLSDNLTYYKYYAIFDSIAIKNIDLTNDESDILQSEIRRVTSFSKNNFLDMRSNITSYRDALSDIYGMGDATYNETFGRQSVAPQLDPSLVELNTLLNLENTLKSIDFILANLFAVDTVLDPFALARANANNPEIDIGQYSSGQLVKINYGEDLQSLAYRYLNDPNKWIDIAIANGLKPPYIDEVGEIQPLIANGNGNQINLAGTDVNGNQNIDKLYINQPVFLQSNTHRFPEQRTITNLRQIPISGEIIIELDGAPDLEKYTIVDAATIKIYKPNTINSSFFILIPSQEPIDDSRREDTPWFMANAQDDEKRAKIDLAISADGDLNFLPNGDLRLSYGIENAIQAIKLKIITELGSLRYHPNFGLVNVIGNKNNNIDSIRDSISNSLRTQIESDMRFDRIETLNVDYLVDNQNNNTAATAIGINLTVKLAGSSNKTIPISFSINNI